MSTSQTYLDVVGSLDPVWPAAYNGAITTGCARCGALRFVVCINPATGKSAKVPCVARLLDAA